MPSPTDFFFGPEEIQKKFVQAINQKRMPHAWLLVGPEGVGKKTLAYTWVRFLLGNGRVLQPQDTLFRRIAMETHGDFYVLRGHLVEDVRLLRQFLQKSPVESERRVVLLPRVDLCTTHAANALLKILEEPADHTFFILTARNLGALMPTIRSRCRMMNVSPLGFGEFTEGFEKICLSQGNQIPDLKTHQTLWELSEGCLGRALTLYTEEKVEDLIHLEDIWTRGLLSRNDPDFLPSFHPRNHSFWSQLTVSELAHFVENWVCNLMLEGARQELTSMRFRIYKSQDLDTWVRANEKLAAFFKEAQTFHLDPVASAVVAMQILRS